MAKEIERKFLVSDDSYISVASQVVHIAQGYLSTDPEATVRVRVADDRAYITVKSRTIGATRNEWEYPIPVDDALEMLRCCKSMIEKYRYIVNFEGYKWEVDRFVDHNSGLVLAEIELPSESAKFSLPPFIGEEVTGDPKYYNSVLSRK